MIPTADVRERRERSVCEHFRAAGRAFECRMTAFFLFDESSDHSPGSGIVCERVHRDQTAIRAQLLGG